MNHVDEALERLRRRNLNTQPIAHNIHHPARPHINAAFDELRELVRNRYTDGVHEDDLRLIERCVRRLNETGDTAWADRARHVIRGLVDHLNLLDEHLLGVKAHTQADT